MTSAADPHDFPTMEITLGSPGKNGELAGPVILSGQTLSPPSAAAVQPPHLPEIYSRLALADAQQLCRRRQS